MSYGSDPNFFPGSTPLAQAILAARSNPANASFFANNPSNYLYGEVQKGNISTSDLVNIINTGTVNATPGSSLIGLVANLTRGTQQPNTVTPPTPTTTGPQGAPTANGTFTDSLKQGFQQLKSQIGPTGLIIGIGLVGFLALRSK